MVTMAGPRSHTSTRDPVLSGLIDEVSRQLEAGEPVDLDAFIAAHPERADALRLVLPALAVLADLGRSAAREPRAGMDRPDSPIEPLGELGDYRILREIGRGGMGVVYEATQISLNRRVALKVLPFAGALDSQHLARFRLEAQAAAQLHHTNIVPVFAVGCERGVHYYAMQFIEGQTLAALIRDLRECEGQDESKLTAVVSSRVDPEPSPLVGEGGPKGRMRGQTASAGGNPAGTSPHIRTRAYFRTVATLGLQAAEALDHAHRFGILHRDIKPANLLLDIHGNLWVTDFGLARCADDASLTMTGDLLGTLRYMSPEQALGHPAVIDERSDVYSLGATLYELLTLRPAFDGRDRREILRQIAYEEPPPPRKLNSAVPRELETIVLKAMSKEPESRYATTQELAEDIGRFLVDRPIKARRPSLAERATKWSRRHRGVVASALIILTFATASLAASTVLINRQRELAEMRSDELLAASDALEWQLYFSLVNWAQTEWSSNNIALADRLLDSCPSAHRGWEWHYCKRMCHLESITFRRHSVPILGLAYSSDGSQLISLAGAVPGEGPGEMSLWDAATGRRFFWIDVESASCLAVSPVTGLAAVGFPAGITALFDIKTGQRRGEILPPSKMHTSLVRGVAFSHDGKELVAAIGTHDEFNRPTGSLELWDVGTRKHLRTFRRAKAPSSRVAFSPDGTRVASGGWDGVIRIWDPETGDELRPLHGHDEIVMDVAYSPDGRLLASAGWDGTVKIWEPDTGVLVRTLVGHGSFVNAVTFSPDGSQLVSASNDDSLKIWEPGTGREIATLRGHVGSARHVAFSPGGNILASGGDDATVRIWQLAADHHFRSLRHEQWVQCVAFSPDGSRVASASRDRTVRLWDSASGRELATLGEHDGEVNSLAFSPDGHGLVTGCWDGLVRLWDLRECRVIRTLDGHKSRVVSVAYSRDGSAIASVSWDGTLRIWDPATGREARQLSGHEGTGPNGILIAVAFSPEGNLLASAGMDQTVRVWDYRSGLLLRTLPCRSALDSSHLKPGMLAFSPDGRLLAACSAPDTKRPEGQEIRVWDVATGRRVLTLSGHTELITALAFSPDGTRLASSSLDKTVKLRETDTGREVFTLRGHRGGVLSVAFSPGGQQLASGSIDYTVRLWDARSTAESPGLVTLMRDASHENSADGRNR